MLTYKSQQTQQLALYPWGAYAITIICVIEHVWSLCIIIHYNVANGVIALMIVCLRLSTTSIGVVYSNKSGSACVQTRND